MELTPSKMENNNEVERAKAWFNRQSSENLFRLHRQYFPEVSLLSKGLSDVQIVHIYNAEHPESKEPQSEDITPNKRYDSDLVKEVEDCRGVDAYEAPSESTEPLKRNLDTINFWKRLEDFISNVQVNDPMSEEEKELILKVCEENKQPPY